MYKQKFSPLCESIQNVNPNIDKIDYIERLKTMNNFFDQSDAHIITSVFLTLHYSNINSLLMILFSYIFNYKHQNLSSFYDFNKNMVQVKTHYP